MNSEEETEINATIEHNALRGNQAAYVGERMLNDQGNTSERLQMVMSELPTEGPSYTQTQTCLNDIVNSVGEIEPNRRAELMHGGCEFHWDTANRKK